MHVLDIKSSVDGHESRLRGICTQILYVSTFDMKKSTYSSYIAVL